MDNNSIIEQQFFQNNKLVGKLKYKKIRTMSFLEKVTTIYITEVEVLNKEHFHIHLQEFLEMNEIIKNFVVLDPKIIDLQEFFPHKIVKELYYLRYDQFLNPTDVYDNNLFDRSLQIYNNFFRMNKIENWAYRTKKENKKIFKDYLKIEYEIYRSAFSYVVVKNNFILEYAYEDFKDFMKLISRFPKGTKIESYQKIDKRHFTKSDGEIIIAYSNKKINLFL